MVTELKERQEKQVTPASREETINRLDVIEQRISEMQGKSGIPENMVQEILNQIGSIRKGQSENQKQDLEDIKGLIVTSHRYFKERLKVLFPADDTPAGEITPVSWYGKLIYRVTPYLKPKFFLLSAGFIICIISLILNIRFTSSTATSANPPAFARCASWLMLLASPASLRIVSASCLFSRGVTSAETTACRTYSLTRSPASVARFLIA